MMYTDVDPFTQPAIAAKTVAPKAPAVSTTLYDLIRAVQELVTPHQDALVVDVVAYLLYSGYMTLDEDVVAHEVSTN